MSKAGQFESERTTCMLFRRIDGERIEAWLLLALCSGAVTWYAYRQVLHTLDFLLSLGMSVLGG